MGETTDMELGGAALKAGSAIAAGKTKDNLEQANASIADQQAKSELASGAYNANLAAQKGKMIMGQQVSAIGGNNLQQGGTNATVVADTAKAQEANVLQIQNNALRKAWGFDVQGASDTFEGQQANTAGILSGVGDLVSGGTQAYGSYVKNLESQF